MVQSNMAMTSQEVSAAVRTLQQGQKTLQQLYAARQNEKVLKANNIRANSTSIDNIRGELLALENKHNDTVEPVLAKLSKTMSTLQSTLDYLGPLPAQVDKLTSSWKKMSHTDRKTRYTNSRCDVAPT